MVSRRVLTHPTPRDWSAGSMSTVAPAPKRHRIKLLLAIMDAEWPGNISTIRVWMELVLATPVAPTVEDVIH